MFIATSKSTELNPSIDGEYTFKFEFKMIIYTSIFIRHPFLTSKEGQFLVVNASIFAISFKN